MAQPTPSLTGTGRIRSLKNQDAIFQAFDSYPWKKDKTFMSGLYAILGDPNNPQGSLGDMATHARIFYYTQKIGVAIDFSHYQSWLSQHPEHQLPDVLPHEYVTPKSPPPASLPWQQAAPKADLYIDKKAAANANPDGGEPSYPMGFADMIRLLQEGKEVPGIRQIPNTVVRNPSVKPVGLMTVPRKPWEKANAAPAAELDITKALDTEFPPLDPDAEIMS